MTLDQLESLASIAASLIAIFFTVYPFIKGKPSGTSTANEVGIASENWKTKYTVAVYIKWIRLYIFSILFFVLILANIATNNNPVTALDAISISACTGAIILMLMGCAYKYVLWQTSRAFDSNIER